MPEPPAMSSTRWYPTQSTTLATAGPRYTPRQSIAAVNWLAKAGFSIACDHSFSVRKLAQRVGLPVRRTSTISRQTGLSFTEAKYGATDHGDESHRCSLARLV